MRKRTLWVLLAATPILLGGRCVPTAGPPEPEAPGLRFSDIAARSGVRYRWEIPGKRPLNILQTIGNGCALFDFNGDDNLDLLLVGPKTALYLGDGKGKFTDVSAQQLPATLKGHLGCAVGDYSGDGWPDIYLTAYRGGTLLKNQGGKGFVDATKEAQVAPQPWSTSAAFLDYDADGKLDLYIGNYADFGPDKKQLCPQQGILTSCGPREYSGIPGVLLKNIGGKFTDVTKATNAIGTGRCLGVAVLPADAPGALPTISLANDEIAGDLLVPERKNGAIKYTNRAQLAGTAFDKDGNVHGGMGTDWGDYDGDGKLDLFVATFQNEVKCLYRNEGDWLFTDMAIPTLLASPTRPWVAFGCTFFDADNDSQLDLAIANGHVQDNIQQIQTTVPYRQATQLLRGQGGSPLTFEDVSSVLGGKPIVGRGLASGDWNNDGKQDLLVVDSEGEPLLFENETTSVGRWLGLRLLTRSGRDAYGAIVTVSVGGKKLVRHCHSDGSYMSASDPRVHIGLGAAQKPDSVTIRWPNGKETTHTDLPEGRYSTVREP